MSPVASQGASHPVSSVQEVHSLPVGTSLDRHPLYADQKYLSKGLTTTGVVVKYHTMKVKVYFNLHRKLFSVVALEGERKGRVIAHETELWLANAKFKVSEAGRQRVLREQRKNVHAFVVGEIGYATGEAMVFRQVTYNPYLYSSFVFKDSKEPVYSADLVWLENKKIHIT